MKQIKTKSKTGRIPVSYPVASERLNPLDGIVMEPGTLAPLNCVYRDDPHGIFLYQGDCLELLDAIAAKHPDGCFDMIFADPPYEDTGFFEELPVVCAV